MHCSELGGQNVFLLRHVEADYRKASLVLERPAVVDKGRRSLTSSIAALDAQNTTYVRVTPPVWYAVFGGG